MRSLRYLLPLFSLAACSGGSTSTDPGTTADPGDLGDPGAGPTTTTEYCNQLWDAYATRWAACERASAADAAAIYDPAARCGNMIQAVAAGRATFDARSAASCLSFLGTASCDELEAWMNGSYGQASCSAAVAGKLGTGETCYSDYACASGRCQGTLTACPFTCQTVVPLGSPCSTSVWCEPGSYCNVLLAAPVCQQLLGVGGDCSMLNACAAGLHCTGVGTRTCQPRKTSGSCVIDEECAVGYHCASSSCAAWLGPGDVCTQGSNACGAGLWCDGTGTCVDGSTGTGACGYVNGEKQPCIGGVCGGSACSPWATEGGTCSTSPQCGPVMSCASNVCAYACTEP